MSEILISELADINPPLRKLPKNEVAVGFIPMSAVRESGGVYEIQELPFADVGKGFTRFQDDDVLFAKITPCMENGKGAHVKDLPAGIGCGSTEFHVLRARPGHDSAYIYQLMQWTQTRLKAETFMSGSAGQQRVLSDFFFRYRVFAPNQRKQQKIAHILQTIDRAIEHTEALIDKYQQIKAGLMHDLFTRGIGPNGQLRPPRDQAPELYQQTSIGWLPKEWSVVSLKDETMISHGFAFSGNGFFDEPPGGVLLTPGNFHRDGGLYFTSGNTKYFRGDIPPETILSSGELVTVMTDLSPQTLILGRFATVNTDFPVLHNQRIGLVKCQKPDLWDRLYLVAALNNERIRKEIILGATGTTVRHTSPGRILSILIACPSMEEQNNCADMLSRIQDKLGQETSFLEKLQKQKSGLMHDLLTGKVPVKVDAAAPEVAHD